MAGAGSINFANDEEFLHVDCENVWYGITDTAKRYLERRGIRDRYFNEQECLDLKQRIRKALAEPVILPEKKVRPNFFITYGRDYYSDTDELLDISTTFRDLPLSRLPVTYIALWSESLTLPILYSNFIEYLSDTKQEFVAVPSSYVFAHETMERLDSLPQQLHL